MKSGFVYILLCLLIYGTAGSLSVYGYSSDSIFVYQNIPTDPQTVMAGKTLFGAQCAECHAIGHEIIGPALASVHTRRPFSWLVRFIQNSQEVIQGGDEYANFLYEQYRQTVMPPMQFLSEEEILSILAYIQYESSPPKARGGVTSKVKSEYFDHADTEAYLPPESLTQRKANENKDHSFSLIQKVIFGVLVIITLSILLYLSYLIVKKFR